MTGFGFRWLFECTAILVQSSYSPHCIVTRTAILSPALLSTSTKDMRRPTSAASQAHQGRGVDLPVDLLRVVNRCRKQ